jgi:hypothetical protein
MIDLYVDVVFENLTVVAGAVDGISAPVESFILNGFVYKIDTNGTIYPDSTTTGGDTFKYLVFGGVKYKYTNDINGQLYPESSISDSGQRTFWMMIDANDVIWVVGANSNGGFDPQYLI